MRAPKNISMKEFKRRDYDPSDISNHKIVDGICSRCRASFSYSKVKTFLRSRRDISKKHLWESCGKCWHIINTSEDQNWIDKNRAAQLISQNTPEQKRKNAEGVSGSWTSERKETNSIRMRQRWKEDAIFAAKALKNLEWTSKNNEFFHKTMRKSLGRGGLSGVYKGLDYQSALELSYILWCEDQNIPIKRYDLDPIDYEDEVGKSRKYFPDFIINNKEVIEIKGRGLYYNINYDRNIKKLEAAKLKVTSYRMILGDDKCLKKFYRKARRIHHENKE